ASPNETDRNAGLLGALIDFAFGAEFRHAEEFANDFRRDDHLFRFPFGDAACLFSREGPDFAFEIANAGFARAAGNDFLQALIGEFELLADFQAVLGGLLRDQVLVSDMQLLFTRVARELDDFHTVAQWLGDRIHPVGGGDEGDL